jgi:predicted ABC-type exoprotein transport system permease subunit
MDIVKNNAMTFMLVMFCSVCGQQVQISHQARGFIKDVDTVFIKPCETCMKDYLISSSTPTSYPPKPSTQ